MALRFWESRGIGLTQNTGGPIALLRKRIDSICRHLEEDHEIEWALRYSDGDQLKELGIIRSDDSLQGIHFPDRFN